MLHCPKCNQTDPHYFSSSVTKSGQRCIKCMKKYQADWYRKNKTRHKDSCNIISQFKRKQFQEFIQWLKTGQKCPDCGGSFGPQCFDFDHLSDKKFNISSGFNYGRQTIMQQIYKCELVCANCHRTRTKNRKVK